MGGTRCVAVACSGGRDSIALLHATAQVARHEGWQVAALHVHHGLNPQADDWVRRLEGWLTAWREAGLPVTLAVRRLETAPPRGASVEAWARAERYGALGGMAQAAGAGVVLLAHHRRDQAETLLLQALRGRGLAGLAAMPATARRAGLRWLRPWLHRPRSDIEAYVAAHGLEWIDDDSNGDPRLARNRLRLAVWPALTAAFPQAEHALADAARWAAQAQDAIDEWVAQDLATLGADVLSAGLPLPGWLALSEARRALVLRAWLQKQVGGRPAPASLVLRLADELPRLRVGRWPAPGGELRLYRGMLRWHAGAGEDAAARGERRAEGFAGTGLPMPINRPGRYRVVVPGGWDGWLEVTPVAQGGVPLGALAALELRPRRGGETFQAGPGRPPRALRKQYQAFGVPAWQRGGPLMVVGERLVAVPGLGIDARALGAPGEPMVRLEWQPHEPASAVQPPPGDPREDH